MLWCRRSKAPNDMLFQENNQHRGGDKNFTCISAPLLKLSVLFLRNLRIAITSRLRRTSSVVSKLHRTGAHGVKTYCCLWKCGKALGSEINAAPRCVCRCEHVGASGQLHGSVSGSDASAAGELHALGAGEAVEHVERSRR